MPPVTDEHSASVAARRVRRRRLLIALLFLAALAALASWFVAGPASETYRKMAERAIAEAVGGQARLGRLDIRLWRLEASFGDLEVVLPGETGPPLKVSVPEGRARLAWSGVLGLSGGRVHLRNLELDRTVVSIDKEYSVPAQVRPWGARPLDLRIDHLRLRDGTMRFRDRLAPMDVDATRVRVMGRWKARDRALVGDAELVLSFRRPPLLEALPLQVRTGFQWRRHDLRLVDLEADGPGIELNLGLSASFIGRLALVGRGEARLDSGRLAEFLDPAFPEIEGQLAAPFSVESGEESLRVRARVKSGPGRFGPFAFTVAAADARYSHGSLELDNLEAGAFDGQVKGSVEIGWRNRPRFSARVTGRDLDAGRIVEWVGLPLPLASRVNGRVDLGGVASDRGTWNGGGEFVAVADTAAKSGLQATGPAEFVLRDGVVSLRASDLSLVGGTLGLDLEADLAARPPAGSVLLEGRIASAAEIQSATLAVCGSLGITTPRVMHRSLEGNGDARARIGFGVEESLAFSLRLGAGSYAGQPFDEALVELARTGNVLAIERVSLGRPEQRLAASGRIHLDPFDLRSLELSARGLDPAWMLGFFGLTTELTGRLDSEFSLESRDARDGGKGWLRIRDGTWYGERFDQLSAEAVVDLNGLHVEPLSLTGPIGNWAGRANWEPSSGTMSLVVDRGTLELADLEIVKSRRLDLAGELEVHGSLGAISGVWRGGCTLTGTGLSVAGQDLAAAQGVATYGPGGLAFRVDGKGRGAWVAEGSVSRASEGGLDATVILDAVQLNLTEEFGTEAHAALSGSARVRGPVDALERLELEGNVSESALILGDRTFRTGESAPVTLESGRFSLGPLRIVGDDTDVELQLTYDSIRDELDSGAGGFFDLGALGVWLPAVRASGRVELAAQAVGPLDRPDFSGALRSNDSRIRWLGFPQALDELSFTLRLDRQQAELLDLRARMGNGEIRGDGAAEFEGFRVGSFAARIRGANVRLLYPEGFRGIYEGDLTLSGTEDSARLSGRIELLRGLYDQGFALGLSESSSREYAPVGAESMPDVALDVDLLADGNVWVRNRLAEVESNLELHLGGTLARPEVTGRVWLVEGGKLSYRGVEYQLRTGSVDLVATDRLDPYLTLEADTVVEDYTILLRIEGTLDRFEYELTSEPPLGTEEIIALLTTGQTLEQIDSAGGSSFTGDVAANYFAGAVTDRLEEEIRRVLRLSRLRIDPLLLQGTADPTTRVTVGQEVADDLYVIFSAELGGDRERQIYQMEWLATGKIGFTAERDNLGGVGGSIRYRDRFWLHRPGDRESAVPMQLTPASPESERARLVSIDVEGIPDEEWAEIETVIPVHVGEAFSRSAAFSGVEAIRGYYVRRGWIESQVDARVTPESDGFSVVFQVDPGPQTEVRFDGVSQKEERRLRTLLQGFWTESVFSEDLYADSVQLIVKYFHERGFYTVDVFHVLDVEDDRQVVTFDIDRGQPVRVTYLTILGGEEIEQERVRKQMLTRSSTWLSKRPLVPEVLDDDVQAIRNLYRDQGFLSAKVSSPRIRLATNGRAADVELEIDAGPVYSVSEVRFPDEPFTPDEYREWAEFGPGDVFSKRRLLGAEGRIRGALDTRGYPDARVRGRVELDGTLATVAFEVEAGGFKRFREVVVRGNRRTREKVIRRELGIVPGDLVSREKLLAAQQRLNRLGLFRSVRLTYGPIDDADPAAHKLDVAVEEMAPFSTHVGLGYDSEIRTRVNFAVTNHNLAGYDRVLSVQGFLSGPEKRLALVGQEPRLFALRLPATLNLAWQESERDGFSQTRVGGAVRVDRRFTPVWAGHARYGLDRVTLSDVTDPTAVVEEKLEDLRLGSVGVAMTRVTYDSPFTPTQGALVDLAAALFSRPLLSEASFVALNASAAGVHTFPSGVAAAGAVRVGLAFPFGDTDVVPISERFFAGGSNSLRGFARDSVGPKTDAGTPTGGESLFVINGEFRIPVWRQVHGVIFYDIGNVYATVSDMNLTELRKVLGAGVRLETPIGPFRLEYGRKLDQKEGESAGELYLSIGNPF